MALGQEYTWPLKTNNFPAFEKQRLWGDPSGKNNMPTVEMGTRAFALAFGG